MFDFVSSASRSLNVQVYTISLWLVSSVLTFKQFLMPFNCYAIEGATREGERERDRDGGEREERENKDLAFNWCCITNIKEQLLYTGAILLCYYAFYIGILPYQGNTSKDKSISRRTRDWQVLFFISNWIINEGNNGATDGRTDGRTDGYVQPRVCLSADF